MRTVLALALLWCLALASTACETQPLLARCENNLDCDRNTMSPTSTCVLSATRAENSCTMAGADCYCCPTAALYAMNTDPTIMDRCHPMVQPVDVVIVDATDDGGDGGDAQPGDGGGDAAADAAADAPADAPADDSGACTGCIKGLQYCDRSAGICRALRSEGVACASSAECRSTFCVGAAGSAVCCDLACTTPGWSCTAPGAPAGRCSPLMSVSDAGSDATRD